MIYRKRSDKIDDPRALLGVMRTCRKAMTDASSTVRPMGVMYHGLGMVVAAIDALATLLVGRESYFWATGGGATEAQRSQHQRDLEAEAGGAE